VLEINPEHHIVKALLNRLQSKPDDHGIEQYGQFLFDQALIAEGSRLSDPAAFLARVNEMAARELES
jgi:molecular chaperone HtpG